MSRCNLLSSRKSVSANGHTDRTRLSYVVVQGGDGPGAIFIIRYSGWHGSHRSVGRSNKETGPDNESEMLQQNANTQFNT